MPTLEGDHGRGSGRHLSVPARLAARGAPRAAGCPFLRVQLVLTFGLGTVGQGEGPPLPGLDRLWEEEPCGE